MGFSVVPGGQVGQEGGSLLLLRAVIQPWSEIKLKMTLGLVSAEDIGTVPDSDHLRFSFINFISLHIPILPPPPENTRVCLPFAPYLICEQEENDEEVPRWKALVRAVNGIFQNTMAPHSKSNMDTLNEVLKNDWKVQKVSKYIYPVLVPKEEETDAVEETENVEGEKETLNDSSWLMQSQAWQYQVVFVCIYVMVFSTVKVRLGNIK